jgi:hypothetical protein
MMEESESDAPHSLVDGGESANGCELERRLTLDVPPPQSPSRAKGGTSPRSPRRSPNKHSNLLNVGTFYQFVTLPASFDRL